MLDPSQAAVRLRSTGLRLTPQRRAVIDALAGNRTHPTADDVAALVRVSLPGVSLSTIYNTLHEFTQAGLLLEIGTAKSLRFDPELAPHAHLVCASCGLVSDVDVDPALVEALADAAGTPLKTITMSGMCESCTGPSEVITGYLPRT